MVKGTISSHLRGLNPGIFSLPMRQAGILRSRIALFLILIVFSVLAIPNSAAIAHSIIDAPRIATVDASFAQDEFGKPPLPSGDVTLDFVTLEKPKTVGIGTFDNGNSILDGSDNPFKVSAQVSASDLTIDVRVSSTPANPSPTNNPSPIDEDAVFEFNIIVTNSTTTVSNVVISGTLNPQIQFVGVTSIDPNDTYDEGTLIWTIDTLSSSSPARLDVEYRANVESSPIDYQAEIDLGGQIISDSIQVPVNAVNDPPVAVDDPNYQTDEDTQLVVNVSSGVRANDTDVDNLTTDLSVTVIDDVDNGTLTLNSDGSFTYDPDLNFNGADTFTYRANDGSLDSLTDATVTITVNAVNDPPVAVDDPNYQTDEDTQLVVNVSSGVRANDTDVDNLTTDLSVTVIDDVDNGTLTLNSDGSFTYDPDLNFNGADTFTYRANDGSLDSLTDATVTITVNAVNDPPVAVDDPNYQTDEDTQLVVNVSSGVRANDTDVDNLTTDLSVTVIDDVDNGTLTLNSDGSFTYDPDLNFNGADTFTYRANDGSLDSLTDATVTITVNAINDPPVAVDDPNYQTDEDTQLVVNVSSGVRANDTDVDNLTTDLSVTVIDDVDNGTLTLNSDGSFTYDPDLNFNGADTFTYRANDGSLDSLTDATVTITVNAVNDPPVAVDDPNYQTDEDTQLVVNVSSGVRANDTDVDNLTTDLSVTVIDDVDNGTLTLNSDGSFTYDPDLNFNGADTFTYRANDGSLDSLTDATVTITVNAVNDPPVAVDDPNYQTDEDTQLVVNVSSGVRANDTDVDNLTTDLSVTVIDDVDNGTLTLNSDGSFTYDPDLNFNGADTFTYRANDGSLDSLTDATVTITVNAINDPPTLDTIPTPAAINEDAVEQTIGLSGIGSGGGSDESGQALTVTAVSDNTGLIPNPVSVDYIPNQATGSVRYTPEPDAFGSATITVEVDDSQGSNNIVQETFTITVNAVNDPPVAVDDPNYQTDEDTQLVVNVSSGVRANDTDVDNLTTDLSVTVIDDVDNGTLTLNSDGSFTYDPDLNFNGADTFTYRANDGSLDSLTDATVTITVNAVNDPPVAVDDPNYQTDEDTQLVVNVSSGVRANDTDVDNLTTDLSVTVIDDVDNGTLTLNSDGSFTYDPDLNFNGADTFTYRANDGSLDSLTDATVTITVNAINDPPVAVDDPNYQTDEDTQLVVNTASGVRDTNDTDVDNLTTDLSVTVIDDVDNGTLLLNSDGSFTYDPDLNFNGADTFTYRANDGSLDSLTDATVTITVNAVNDPPTLNAILDPAAINEDAVEQTIGLSGIGSGGGSDESGQTLVVTASSDNTGLIPNPVSVDYIPNQATGSVRYTPEPDAFGSATITVEVDDNQGSNNTVQETFTVTVNAVNDPPVAVDDPNYQTDEDTQLVVNVSSGVRANDTDVDNLTTDLSVTVIDDVDNGTLTLNSDGSFTYDPDLNFNGADTFTYRANDGSLDSLTDATVTITVNAVNDPPVANDDAYSVSTNTTLNVDASAGVLINDTDTEDAMSSLIVGSVQNDPANVGTKTPTSSGGEVLVRVDGSFDYTPPNNFTGPDSFVYKVEDTNNELSLLNATVNLQIFTVNSAADPGDGVCNASECTLREALNTPALGLITFNISGSGPHTITLSSELPAITRDLTIDGTTQQGSVNNSPMIVLDGQGTVANGLHITAGISTIKGLVIQNFTQNGILVETDGNTIQSNYIGTDADGTAIAGNGQHGIYIRNASDNIVGATSDITEGNVISGNAVDGIRIQSNTGSSSDASNNQIRGNKIGVEPNGTELLGNGFAGITILAGDDNIIGCAPDGINVTADCSINRSFTENIISANGTSGNSDGALVLSSSDNNILQGNLIGTDGTGTAPRGNEGAGIAIFGDSSDNVIGWDGNILTGTEPSSCISECNTIAFNSGDGVLVDTTGSRNTILSNSIFSNGGEGIILGSDVTDVQLPPTLATARTTASNELAIRYNVTSDSSVGNNSIRVQFFDTQGTFLGSDTYPDPTNTPGGFEDVILPLGTVQSGDFVTANATNAGGNSSAFAVNVQVDAPATHKVNSLRDLGDSSSEDNVCDTGFKVTIDTTATSTIATTECTLRAAIEQSNELSGPDTIIFELPSDVAVDGLYVIPVSSALGDSSSGITDSVVIDGTTQEGYNGTPVIVLDGSSDTSNGPGFLITSGDTTVRGLSIIQFGSHGIHLQDNGDNLIEDNYIGTDPVLNEGLGNSGVGIRVSNSSGNTITHNVIASNAVHGVRISGSSATNNTLQNNSIGTDDSGFLDLGNGGDGVFIFGASDNLIGDDGRTTDNNETATDQGNIIAFNAGSGVALDSGAGERNAINGNLIYSNGAQGIDLENDGTTLNDGTDDDVDSGPNKLMNFPEFDPSKVRVLNNSTLDLEIQYRVDTSTDNAAYPLYVEFYKAGSLGQGRDFLGSDAFTDTDRTDTADGDFKAINLGRAIDLNIVVGDEIVALATDADGNTSEFSNTQAVIDSGLPRTFVVNSTADPGTDGCDAAECTLREAINEANIPINDSTPGLDRINFNIGAGEIQTISIAIGQPALTITDPIIIDGTTEPGFSGTPIIVLDGTNADNNIDGLIVTSGNSLIKSIAINGFKGNGVVLSNGSANSIEGNYIGIDPTGTFKRPNHKDAVKIQNSSNNLIGGTNSEDRNVIAGNFGYGLRITDLGSVDNLIQGNFIGTDKDGDSKIANDSGGIAIINASDNTIGGIISGASNVISGNGEQGIFIQGSSSGNQVQGNFIGTDLSSTLDIGNDSEGIRIENANDNCIGGEFDDTSGQCISGFGNVIAFNSKGVVLESGPGNAILSNSMFDNVLLGIDLDNDGFTANDSNDVDSGSNNLQNFPTLVSARIDASNALVIKYSFDSPVSDTNPLTIEFFIADSDAEEGKVFLDSDIYDINDQSQGVSTFTIPEALTGGVKDGDKIIATATDNLGNTSEFSRPALTVIEASFSVNSNADGDDADITDGVCADSSGSGRRCTLRAAIQQANATDGEDLIEFNLLSSNTQIAVASTLPTITEEVVIDGTSQPLFSDTVFVTITGSNATTGPGLHVTSGNTTIRGLQISGFVGDGLRLENGGNNVIQDVRVQGNKGAGVSILNSANNVIGGTDEDAGNSIQSNEADGINISGSASTGNLIQGNEITSNTVASSGISIVDAEDNIIGGTSTEARNFIVNNVEHGIIIENTSAQGEASGNLIQGNFIGTLDGASDNGNIMSGIQITDASSNIVGGTDSGASNVISGNDINGIQIESTSAVSASASQNQVLGNLIGTTSDGSSALTNSGNGISIVDSASNTIGGSLSNAANVISGNTLAGIRIESSSSSTPSTLNVIEGNFIGTDAAGALDIGNGGAGVHITGSGSTANCIGGQSEVTGVACHGHIGNTIAFNDTNGVLVDSGAASNAILSNMMFDNTGEGISKDGNTTQNVEDDPDIKSAKINAYNNLVIRYSANASSSTTYIEFFEADSNGQGKDFFKSDTYNTSGTRAVNLGLASDLGISTSDDLVATVTVNGNTSEFAAVEAVADAFTFTVDSDGVERDTTPGDGFCNTGSGCTLTAAIEEANHANNVGADTIVFSGSMTIQMVSSSTLPVISDPIVIDGSSNQSNVVIDGLGVSADGLHITSGDSTIRGLTIHSFNGSGILLDGDGSNGPNSERNPLGTLTSNVVNNVVEGSYIGTDGLNDLGNRDAGVFISESSNNLLGGTTVTARNVISGNGTSTLSADGVTISGSNSTGNQIEGNFIGTSENGVDPLPNSGSGVRITGDASNNCIGGRIGESVGNCSSAPNTIAFNEANGVTVESGSGNSIVANNIFGNAGLGIKLPSGSISSAPDLLSARVDGNDHLVVRYSLSSTSQVEVEFFKKGTTSQRFLGSSTYVQGGNPQIADLGLADDPNPELDIDPGDEIVATATYTDKATSEFSTPPEIVQPSLTFEVDTELDSIPADPNDLDCGGDGDCTLREAIAAANSGVGLDNIRFEDSYTIKLQAKLPDIDDSVTIVGTDSGGQSVDVIIDGQSDAFDGLTFTDTAGESLLDGITLQNFDGHGVVLDSSNNTVQNSTLINVTGDGIRVKSGIGNSIRTNNMSSIGEQPINLLEGSDDSDGATPNDLGDGDDFFNGPNELQNFPIINSSTVDAVNSLVVEYEVDTDVGSAIYPLKIEFFKRTVSNNSVSLVYLGEDDYEVSDAQSEKAVDLGIPVDGNNQVISVENAILVATATDNSGNLQGNTSEVTSGSFEQTVKTSAFVVDSNGDAGDSDATDAITDGLCKTAIDGKCTLRAAIEQANRNPGADEIRFDLTDSHIIDVGSSLAIALPTIIETLIIDGTSEPDYPSSITSGPIVELDGEGFDIGLHLSTNAQGSTIKGLLIRDFDEDGILIETSGNTVESNEISGNDLGGVRISAGADNIVHDNTFDIPSGVAGVTVDVAAANIVLSNTFSGDITGPIVSGLALPVTPTLTSAQYVNGELAVDYGVGSGPADVTYPLHVEFYKQSGGVLTLIGSDTYTDSDFNSGTDKSVNLGVVSLDETDEVLATVTDNNGHSGGNTSVFSLSTSAPPIADLEVTSTASPDPANPGSLMTYTVTVANNGPSDATGVVVTDLLPDEVSYQSDTPDQGTYDSALDEWDVGSLTSGASISIVILGPVDSAATAGTITNVATVSGSGSELDSVTSNDTFTQNVVVQVVTTPTNGGTTTTTGSSGGGGGGGGGGAAAPALPPKEIAHSHMQSSFNFVANEGEGNPASQTLTISNPGRGTLAWRLTDSAEWLTLNPVIGFSAGSELDEVTLTIDVTGLDVGSYDAVITILGEDAENSPQAVNVSLTILPPPAPPEEPPQISVSQESLSLTATQGVLATASRTFDIWNSGGSIINWLAEADVPWLNIDPAGGAAEGIIRGSVNATADPAGLVAGTYAATITITSEEAINSPQVVDVELVVLPPPPSMSISPSRIVFNGAQQGDNPPNRNLTITNQGGFNFNWTATVTADEDWLRLSQRSGLAGETGSLIVLSADLSSITEGSYEATIEFTSPDVDNSPQTVSVGLIVTGPEDTDNDGVFDFIEDDGPNDGDGNDDGIPDRSQAFVASLPDPLGLTYVTLEAPAGSRFSNVESAGNPSPVDSPEGVVYPWGFYQFVLEGIVREQAVDVVMTIDDPAGFRSNKFFKYGPLPGSSSDSWYDFSVIDEDGTGVDVGRTEITLHLVDGLRGDDDLEDNGRIVSIGAPANDRSSDLVLTRTGFPNSLTVVETLAYAINVENAGPTSAQDVTFSETIPIGFRLTSATPSQGTCREDAGVLVCDLGLLSVDDVATVNVVMQPQSEVESQFAPSVQAANLDINQGNNTVTSILSVTAPAIAYDTPNFSFRAIEGNPNPLRVPLQISNQGTGSLRWNIAPSCNPADVQAPLDEWLNVSPRSGATTIAASTVLVGVNIFELPPGLYSTEIFITSPTSINDCQPVQIDLTLFAAVDRPNQVSINLEPWELRAIGQIVTQFLEVQRDEATDVVQQRWFGSAAALASRMESDETIRQVIQDPSSDPDLSFSSLSQVSASLSNWGSESGVPFPISDFTVDLASNMGNILQDNSPWDDIGIIQMTASPEESLSISYSRSAQQLLVHFDTFDTVPAQVDALIPVTATQEEQTIEGSDDVEIFARRVSVLRAAIQSPGELRVFDETGRLTGVVNQNITVRIPNSTYLRDEIVILLPDKSEATNFDYEITGTEEGSYVLNIEFTDTLGNTSVFPHGVNSITIGEVHEYRIDNWDTLGINQGWSFNIDTDSDGGFNESFFYPVIEPSRLPDWVWPEAVIGALIVLALILIIIWVLVSWFEPVRNFFAKVTDPVVKFLAQFGIRLNVPPLPMPRIPRLVRGP